MRNESVSLRMTDPADYRRVGRAPPKRQTGQSVPDPDHVQACGCARSLIRALQLGNTLPTRSRNVTERVTQTQRIQDCASQNVFSTKSFTDYLSASVSQSYFFFVSFHLIRNFSLSCKALLRWEGSRRFGGFTVVPLPRLVIFSLKGTSSMSTLA